MFILCEISVQNNVGGFAQKVGVERCGEMFILLVIPRKSLPSEFRIVDYVVQYYGPRIQLSIPESDSVFTALLYSSENAIVWSTTLYQFITPSENVNLHYISIHFSVI